VLKNKTITLPKSLSNLLGIRNDTKEYSHTSALTAGALTFFLPCGFTQTMQLYAVSTGSFSKGAFVMFLFAVGTAPGLLGIGGLSSFFTGQKARVFFATAGLAVILLGAFNISNASNLLSFPINQPSTLAGTESVLNGQFQEVRMTQDDNGYLPNQFVIKKGIPVKWIINSVSQYSCASYLIMSSYDISQALTPGENIIEFTPTKAGEIKFSCSMGMYRGTFTVIEDGSMQEISDPQQKDSAKAKDDVILPGTQIIKATYTAKSDISPNRFTVSVGKPVRLEIDAKDDGNGCMGSVMVQTLYQRPQFLEKGKTMVMTFTPTTRGQYSIACSMGTPRGLIVVQ
jgi:plastocyanin domain-containing protein